MKLRSIEEALERQGLTVFTSTELRRVAGLTPSSAKFLLIRYVKRGIFMRLKARRGLYCLRNHPPHPLLLANKLLHPSYISLESAMAYHGLIPESVYAMTSVTTETTRTFESMGNRFTYQKVKPSAFAGYRPRDLQGTTILMAEPEKALADYLYFVHLGKKLLNDRIRWAAVQRTKALHYLRLFQRRGLIEWAIHVIPKRDS